MYCLVGCKHWGVVERWFREINHCEDLVSTVDLSFPGNLWLVTMAGPGPPIMCNRLSLKGNDSDILGLFVVYWCPTN